MTAKFKTREQWLNAFIQKARPHFKRVGHPIPEKVRAAVGFTSKGQRSNRIGECWAKTCSEDETFEIFIVPAMSDASRVADILTHELIHAAVGLEDGHGRIFGRCARALGLEGKLTATVAGAEWHEWADPILEKLGPLPHAALKKGESSGPKKQTTRMIKCTCQSCEFVFRTTKKWIEDCGELRCPNPVCDGEVEFG